MPSEFSGRDLLDPKTLHDPYPMYRRLQRDAPVWRVPNTDIFVVSRYDLIEEATRRHRDFSNNLRDVPYRDDEGNLARLRRDGSGLQVLPTADPPAHAEHKAILSPRFSPRLIAQLEDSIDEIAGVFIGRAIEKGSSEFMNDVANHVPVRVVCRLIGFKNIDFDTLRHAAFNSTKSVSGTISKEDLVATWRNSKDVFDLLTDQYENTDPAGGQLLSTLKAAVDVGSLERSQAIAMTHVLLSAGGESTVSLIGNTVRAIAENQDLQRSVREDPELLPSLIEEVLRLESPFRCHYRSVPNDTQLGGESLPAGALVLLLWGAANRDPQVFGDPDRLVLGRPRRHMAFGRGIHNCLGATLARLEARTVVRQLIDRTETITLDPDQAPQWVLSLQVRRHENLPLLFKTS